MGDQYAYEGWQVTSKTVLLDTGERDVRIEIEVAAFDRELDEVKDLLYQFQYLYYGDFRFLDVDVNILSVLAAYIADDFLSQNYRRRGNEFEIQRSLARVPIPQFGSPPAAWETLERALSSLGPFGTAVFITQQYSEDTSLPVLLLFGAGLTVAVNILQPTTKAFGEALASRIRRWGEKGAGSTEQ